jgi:hypothetical protein
VTISNTLIGAIGSSDNEEKGSISESKFDIEYTVSNKKHRNSLSNLDHLYKVIAHPFVILATCIIVFLIFIATRYAGMFIDDKGSVIMQISKDAGVALTYLLTVIGTSVFTKFLEKNDSARPRKPKVP